ncbi:tRNA modification GTPase MnmE [Polymorphobacter glacialis]|uniref:tRNA modification GTPase MnmE n=1 Tax=Sandarakinorhabdus glacialis TaxID=1614636 RepID=A0A916ZQ93_9SPHN|nr:tRNA uridine-5-carboxymethylaminomethyl(34) synthesis GTPase MnmE [Polymorphobacter glacialis]GGE08742.1 tRNA modification GTPase MnmE [Polymorphobacter glacialis]
MTVATIVALASGRPPAAIAVIRISGPAAFAGVAALTVMALPVARQMALRRLVDRVSGVVLDSAMVVLFPGPASATGEDLAELHLHGGIAVVSGVLAALTAMPDVRLAEAGEFTRRGFANGRIDLAQVEGLADLVAAETAAQRDQALALAGGTLSRVADAWRERCIMILAEAEAALDFGEDEEDVAAQLNKAAQVELLALVDELDAALADAKRGARTRDGLTIAISGAPNVGKSSLVNALVERDVAIVTSIAGTTRDAIEVPIDFDGVAAVLIDTAGLRETDDLIEAEGIRRARMRVADADLVIEVIDVPRADVESAGFLVVNKIDTMDILPAAGEQVFAVSATRGDGLAVLRAALSAWAAAVVRPGEPALLSHARHAAAFGDAAEALRGAAAVEDAVLRTEGLRMAARAFGRIAGRVDVDDVLDRIFSRFCIGK